MPFYFYPFFMDKKGLTLVEIVASVVILGLVVAGLAGMFIIGKRHVLHNRSQMTAAELARYFLDPLQMNVTQREWGVNCLTNDTLCSAQTLGLEGINYTSNYNITDLTDSEPKVKLRYVNLTINWTEFTPTP